MKEETRVKVGDCIANLGLVIATYTAAIISALLTVGGVIAILVLIASVTGWTILMTIFGRGIFTLFTCIAINEIVKNWRNGRPWND